MVHRSIVLLGILLAAICVRSFDSPLRAEEKWPALPTVNAAVEMPAQSWPQKPGPRRVRILIHYPGRKLENVNEKTGLMLSLHNWGGSDCAGTANPNVLAERLNVVAICVNYLQSGRKASVEDPEPYDCGFLQSLDALRALWFVGHELRQRGISYDNGRVFATGGSGGGNVTLMANKLAPSTFACVIDMCGMKKLSHDIAFNLPGGTGLNARWSRDPDSKNYLSADEQEIRFVGHPQHLAAMKRQKTTCKVIVVHGSEDTTCPFADAREMVANMKQAAIDVEAHFLTKADLDGKVFTSTGHSLGNRTEIVFRVGGKYLAVDSPTAIRRRGPTDFDRQEEIRYDTTNGQFVISYKHGYPVGRFEPMQTSVSYPEHQDLTYRLDRDGRKLVVRSPAEWAIRRRHILDNLQLVMGRLPGATTRVPLDVKTVEERRLGESVWRKISFQSDPFDRVPAWLFVPARSVKEKLPAVLCLHQTVQAGKDEPVGLTGSKNMHYARELAERGYVVLAPDYPSLGEHKYDFAANPEYNSGSMKAIWDNIRAVDLLQSLPAVDGERIGVIGHSLGGHNAMFTAAFDPRLKVIVSSCGFSRFHRDDVPSWSGPRYMPRIASVYQNDADRLPFDFSEIVASFAPRAFLACAATRDSDFNVGGVRDVMQSAAPIFKLFNRADALQVVYPDSKHDFPPAARERAYEFLDLHLRGEK
jgi:predicted peptidase